MAKKAIKKKVSVKIDDQEPQILNQVILNPKKSWFRDNRWWIAPVIAALTVVIPWFINYVQEKEDEKTWRYFISRQVGIDSVSILMIWDTLDTHKDNFNNLKPSSYKK